MLFLFAFAFGRHSAAALVHFAFLLALIGGIFCYSPRFGFPEAGMCAALLIYLSPVFGFDGTAAYNDVAAGCVVFYLFYLLEIWDERREPALLAAAGLLAGFAYRHQVHGVPGRPLRAGLCAVEIPPRAPGRDRGAVRGHPDCRPGWRRTG